MSPGKVAYRRLMKLEAMRGVSALYVLVHHYVHDSPELASARKFFVFGQFALMVFFILSGFVIYYATVYRNPDISFKEYFLRRFRRIYPAFLLVLALTYLIMCLTFQRWLPLNGDELLGNIFQLQDRNPFQIVQPYWRNAPLWSMAYEWWFYMIFFGVYAAFKNRPDRQRQLAVGISLLGFGTFLLFPNQASLFASYFILWWAGLEIAREWTITGKVTLKEHWVLWSIIFLMGCAWVGKALWMRNQGIELNFAAYPLIQARHYLTVNLVLLMGYAWYKLRWVGFNALFNHFTFLAPITYAIYIAHYPIIYLAVVNRPTGSVWLDILWIVPVVLGLAWWIEKPYQKFFNRLIKVKSGRSPRATTQKPR